MKLDNGMRVLVESGGRADVAAIYVWINAGSADEPAGLWGGAHFLEHMVFKGTRSFGVGEVAAAIEDLGGDLNAWTSFDETVFHATVPGAAAPAAMRVLAEMMREARIDAGELARERKVVLEEIRGGEDDADLVLTEASWGAAFSGHPYGRPIIGLAKSVRDIDVDALRGFYASHYQPSNACVAVAGQVDPEEIARLARELFAGGTKVAPRGLAHPRASAAAKTLRRGFETLLVELSFPGPGHADPDVAALDVLVGALGAGGSSPLETRLRLREGLCFDAAMEYQAEALAGMAVVSLHVRPGCGGDAVAAAREELARARVGDLDPAAIERSRMGIVADRVFGRETADGRAHAMVFDQERMGDVGAWRAYEAAVLAVTPADVERVARKWLAPEREVAVALVPPGEKVALTRATLVPVAPRQEASPIRMSVLDNGVRILLEPDEGEAFAVRVGGLGGALAETRPFAGHAAAWARSVARGTPDLDAVAFSAEVEAMGGGVSASASRSTQWMRGDFLSRNAMPCLDLLLEALLSPAFAVDEVARVTDELRGELAERDDHPEQVLSERLWSLACGAHPYGAPPGGTARSLDRITPARLLARHRRWLRGPNLVVSVTGGFDPERVRRKLARALAGLPSTLAPLWAGRGGPPVPRWPTETRRSTLRCGREQAHLGIAWPGARVNEPAQPELELLAAVLGGQGGRLFLELREAHGLAYAVGAASMEGVVPGLLVCTMATDPARVDEAERELRACVERLREAPVPAAELTRVKRYLEGGYEVEMQTAGARATAMALAELYGIGGPQYRSSVKQRIERVDSEALHARARQVLARPLVIARVMPR